MRRPAAFTMAVLLPILVLLPATGVAQEPATQGFDLSPELGALLRAEMREVAQGMSALAPAIATGDWPTVHDTAAAIQGSYILARSLSAAQREELERVLPAEFKHLDARFHLQAGQLAEAAAARDAELAAFRFGRMMESCVACHARFAAGRFPGLAGKEAGAHGH